MGEGYTIERLHCRYGHVLLVWEYFDALWMPKGVDEQQKDAFLQFYNLHTYRGFLYPSLVKYAISPIGNGTVDARNKVLEHALMKVYNVAHDNWDEIIIAVLWACHTTSKWLTWHTPFCLVYGKEAVMSIEYIVPSLHITLLMHMSKEGALQNRLDDLMQMEEEKFLTEFYQGV